MQIVSIDPGVATGYCIANHKIHEVGICTTLKEVYELLTDKTPDTIVVEKFSRAQVLSKETTQTVKVIGIVELFVEQHVHTELVFQTPYQRRAFIKDAKTLVAQFNCTAKAKPHVTDAVAHWLAFRVKQNKKPSKALG